LKIRKGFVSNSSSSSFIISGDGPNGKVRSTIRIAKEMVKIVHEDYSEEELSGFDTEEVADLNKIEDERFNRVLKLYEENKDFDKPLCIPWTCNYETYIFKNKKGNIHVLTCRNHFWDDLPYDVIDYTGEDGYYSIDRPDSFLDLSDMETKTPKEIQEEYFGFLEE